jgi:hypothetical protein
VMEIASAASELSFTLTVWGIAILASISP